ncbi:MAG: hypothetical protein R3296_10060 [Oleiphilaceae bacterium]|nr:hypothetical protein [Oleiphilaceae bacterium]
MTITTNTLKGVATAVTGIILGVAVLGSGSAAAQEPRIPSDSTIYSWMSHIAGLGVRMPGTHALREASRYVHDHFVASGLENVGYEPADSS